MIRPIPFKGLMFAAAVLMSGACMRTASASPATTLPIEFGFYVREDVACGNFGWAPADMDPPIKLVGRRYMSLSSAIGCDFTSVERNDDRFFQVDMTCEFSLGGQHESYDDRATFRVLDPDLDRVEIAVRDTNVATAIYRYCPQDQLPEPFSRNDIRDVVR